MIFMFVRNKTDSGRVLSGMKAKHQRYEALVKVLHGDLFRYAYWLCHDKHVAEDLVLVSKRSERGRRHCARNFLKGMALT